MQERAKKQRRWRIGELAEATGLTVRTIHHYEHVGLLAPASRTDGQQRIYDEHDVRRLYRICALRYLGLPLADIGRMLDDDDPAAFANLLHAHRARVLAEIDRLTQLRTLLDQACADADRGAETGEVLATIEAMSRVARRSDARRKHDDIDDDDNQAQWRLLGEMLRACMDAGASPSSVRARAVARAVRARIVEFANGDPATLEALAHLRRFAAPNDLAGWDPPLMRYLDQALACLSETEHDHAE